jgi:amino acid transporter
VICMVAQTLGFGTDAAGVKAFSGSSAPLAELGHAYVGAWLGDALDVVAAISALGAGLGCASVGARMLFALSRDGLLGERFAGVSPATGAPTGALAVVMLLDIAGLAAFAAAGTPALKVFFYFATMGVLSLLVMYVVTNIGALRLLFFAERSRPWLEAALPLGGIVVAGYTLYRNVWPMPDPPFNLFPYIVAGWLALGALIALAAPGLGERLARAPAFRVGEADGTAP